MFGDRGFVVEKTGAGKHIDYFKLKETGHQHQKFKGNI